MKGFTGKIQNKDDQLIKELSELVDNYNTDREATTILMRNSNEIRPLPSENRRVRVGGGNPHKLYNKNLETLNLLSEKIKITESERKYLESKLDLYWTPTDYVRYFQRKKKEAELYNNFPKPYSDMGGGEKVSQNVSMEEIGASK